METSLLTEREIELARRIADLRNAKNGSVPNYRETRKHGDWEIHFSGIRAEIAVCKIVNFPIDQHISYDGDSGSPDLYIGNYKTEVKSALYMPPILKFNRVTDFKSDIAILCYCPSAGSKDESVVSIAGGVSRYKFSAEHYLNDFGQGVRACMDADKLSPLAEILEWVKNTKH